MVNLHSSTPRPIPPLKRKKERKKEEGIKAKTTTHRSIFRLHTCRSKTEYRISYQLPLQRKACANIKEQLHDKKCRAFVSFACFKEFPVAAVGKTLWAS